jgi:hypothetical protein
VKPLMFRSEMQEYFVTDRVFACTNALATAKDFDKTSIYNGIGYKTGTRVIASGEDYSTSETSACIATGFIPVKVGDVLYTSDITFGRRGWEGIVHYDKDLNVLWTATSAAMMDGAYFQSCELTEDGLKISLLNGLNDKGTVAYVRFTFYREYFGENPVIAVNEEIAYRNEGFLADGLKVKGDALILTSPGGKAYSLSVSDTGVWTATAITV